MGDINQLSVITDEIGQDFAKVLDLIEPFHISHVELRKIWGKNIVLFSDADIAKLKETLVNRNISVSVVSGPLFKCFLPNSHLNNPKKKSFSRNADYNISLGDRLLEIAAALNCNKVRIFAFFKGVSPQKDNWDFVINQLQTFVDKAKSGGKVAILENERGSFADTIENCLRIIDAIGDPALQLVCDPGNYFAVKKNYLPADYDAIFPHIGHVHVKDPARYLPFFGATFGVVGRGKMNWTGIIQHFQTQGYAGFYSLETHSVLNLQANSLQSLANLQQMIQ